MSPLPTTTDEGRTTTGPNPTELPQHRLVWIWLTLLCGVVGPTVVWLWYRWTLGIWYSGHGILMPWIVGYLVYERLRDDPDREPEASAWGFAFLVPSMLAIALDSAIRTQLLSAVALVTALPGFSLLLLGTRRTKRIIFPLVIAAFMLPIPAGFVAPVHLVLRELSAWGATQLVPLFGIPVHPEGTLLHLPRSTVLVADACSGFSTLYAAITTSLILVHWSPSLPRRAVLLVSAVGLSLICNTVRVVILVLLIHHYGTGLLETQLHVTSGIVTFIAVLALLFVIAGRSAFEEQRS